MPFLPTGSVGIALLSVGSLFLVIGFGLLVYLLEGRSKKQAYEAQVAKHRLRMANSQSKRELVLSEIQFLKLYVASVDPEVRRQIDHLEREIEQVGGVTSHLLRFWNKKFQEVQAVFVAIEEKRTHFLRSSSKKLLLLFLGVCAGFYVLFSLQYMNALTLERYAVWGAFGLGALVLMFVFAKFLYVKLYILLLSKLARYFYWIPAANRVGVVYAYNKLFLYGCIGLTAGYVHLISPYIFLIQVPGILSLFGQIFGALIFLGEILSMLLAFSEVREKLQKRKGH